MKDLECFWNEHAEWSQQTFGSDQERGPVGPLNHLAKEVQEALESPHDLNEYADLLLLTFDATRRAGFSHSSLVSAAWNKLERNRQREWQKPNADGSVEHVR